MTPRLNSEILYVLPNLQLLIRDLYLDDNSPTNDVNDSLENVENTPMTAAKCSIKIKMTKKRRCTRSFPNKKWFDKECRFKRHELRKWSNKKHKDPLNANLRQEYHMVLTLQAWYWQYNNLLTSKKREYYDTKISELENSTNNLDQTSFWKCLKSIDDTVQQKDVPLLISEQNWLYYFQSLHSTKPLNSTWEMTSNELTHLEIRKNQPCPLDYTSTDDEIRAAANKLKNKKISFFGQN